MLTIATCGLCMFGYTMIVRDRGAASCSCVTPDGEGAPGPNARARSMNAALATIAAAKREPDSAAARAGARLPNVLPDAPDAQAEPPAPPPAISKDEICERRSPLNEHAVQHLRPVRSRRVGPGHLIDQ